MREIWAQVRTARDTFVGVALVAGLVYLLPMRWFSIRTAFGLQEYLIIMFVLAIVAGFGLGFVSPWWQLWCARYHEARVSRLFRRDSFVYAALIMIAVTLLFLFFRWQMSLDIMPTNVTARDAILALIGLPIMISLVVVLMMLYVISWIGAFVLPVGLIMALAVLVFGLSIGGTLYLAFEYLRIFFSRQPLEEVLINYARRSLGEALGGAAPL